MNKLLFVVMLAVGQTACLPSSVIQGSGREARGEFDVSLNYSELSVSNGIIVEFVDSDRGVGSIIADEEVLHHVSIVEEGGRVKVSYLPFVTVYSPVKTVVTMPLSSKLVRIDASSAGRVSGSRRISAPTMRIDASSSASIEVDLDTHNLTVDLSSAASYKGNVVVQNLAVDLSSAAVCIIEGTADHCAIETSSAAGFRGSGLICRRAVTNASSGGDIEIAATDELDADASSGGVVRYSGAPSVMRRNTSSGGSIREIKL